MHLEQYSTKLLTFLFQNVQIMKDKAKAEKCFRLKETKKHNTTCDHVFYPRQKKNYLGYL